MPARTQYETPLAVSARRSSVSRLCKRIGLRARPPAAPAEVAITSLARVLLCIAAVAVAATSPPVFGAETWREPNRESGADVEIPTAPVEIDGHVLFRVRGAETLPAEVRAAGIRARVEELAADPTVRTDGLRVVTSGEYARIMAGDGFRHSHCSSGR